MQISCGKCQMVYRISVDKLPTGMARGTCQRCNYKMVVRIEAGDDGSECTSVFADLDSTEVAAEDRTNIVQVKELEEYSSGANIYGGALSKEKLGQLLSNKFVDPDGPPQEDQTVATPVCRELDRASVRPPLPTQSARVRDADVVHSPEADRRRYPPNQNRARVEDADLIGAHDPTMINYDKVIMQVRPATPAPGQPSAGKSSWTTTSGATGPKAQVAASVQDVHAAERGIQALNANLLDGNTFPVYADSEGDDPDYGLAVKLLVGVPIGTALYALGVRQGNTGISLVGFLITLYCLFAAVLSAWDVSHTGRVNLGRSLTVPAVLGIGIIAVLARS